VDHLLRMPGRHDGERTPVPSHLLGILRRFGWNATSFQVLESGFSYWSSGEEDAVAYVDTGRAWVVAGAPIAAPERLGEVAHAFVAAAGRRGRRVVFFATEERFVRHEGIESLLIGEQPVWDPRDWARTLSMAPSLREQLRRARAKHVSVRAVAEAEVSSPEAPLRRSIERMIASWVGSKPMPPMGFLVRVDVFEHVRERRLFVARRGEHPDAEVVGFAAVIPVYARNGWFIEDLIRSPDAPNGTSELLVHAAMTAAAEAGSPYLTLGLSPLAGPVGASLTLARKYGSSLYDFGGLRSFKAKLRPHEWAPIYLSYPADGSALLAIYDSLAAFAQRGLLRYGIETVLWGPDVVLRSLAVLLVPWTVLLASVDGELWFPSPLVQWAWVSFDAVLAALLFALSLRFRRWLSATLVVFVVVDTALTLLQALAFNLERIRGLSDSVVVLVAIAAPALASLILANAHRRLWQGDRRARAG
jgi:phosphatidylglycerol lysyltransferase